MAIYNITDVSGKDFNKAVLTSCSVQTIESK